MTPTPYRADIVTELFIDGAWVNVTASDDVLARDPITITRGRANEAGRVETSKCTFTLDNRDGRYSPRNPVSPYFEKIGRNTPVRQRIRDSPGLLLPATTGSYATTPDAAALDITGDLDLRAELTLESSTGTHCILSKGPSGGPQLSYQLLIGFTAGVPHLTLRWSVDGSATLFVDRDAAMILTGRRIAVRATLDVNNGAGGRTATFYTASSIDGTWTQIGQQTTAGTTSIFSGTAAVEVGQQNSTDHFNGTIFAVRVLNGIGGTEATNPDFDAQTAGAGAAYQFTDAAGRVWSLGSSAQIGLSLASRFTGEIASFPLDWDPSGKDVYVQIEAAGILRRLGQGKAPATSAIRAYLEDTGPDLYLPLDLAAGYGSLDIFVRSSIVPGGGDLGPDMPPGLRVNTTNQSSGGFLFESLNQPASPTEFTIDWLYKAADLGALHFTVWVESGGIFDRFQVQLRGDDVNDDAAVVIERDYFNQGATSQVNTDPLDAITDGNLHHVRLRLAQNGAAVDYTVYIDGVSVLTNTAATLTLKPADLLTIDYTPTTTNYVALGHIVVWYDTAPEIVATSTAVLNSRAGETAGRRIERICEQAGIQSTAIGDLDDTAIMGPQGIKTSLEVLYDCADTDLGILFEPRDFLGLVYRTRKSLYNQPVALTLDYATKVFSRAPKPVDDDQLTRNDVTAKNPSGGAYQAVLQTGRLSVLDPPNGVGVYDTEVSVNVVTDAHLPDQASWRLHLGTIDEARYPMLAVSLHAPLFTSDPVLTADASKLDIGGLLQITNPPAWLPPDDVAQLAQGFTEVLGTHTRDIEVNCVPASPYDIAVYGSAAGTGPDRYDTAGSTLSSAAGSGDTTLLVRSDETLWTTNGTEFPFDILAGGERMTVTGITGGEPLFVGTGTPASDANASGSGSLSGIGLPAGTQVGDVVAILVSIRNTAGQPNTPANWVEWTHNFGSNFNLRIFGRVYDGVWSMPTITFTGGVANATLLGQSAAFRNVTLADSTTGTQANASAQDINVSWFGSNPDQRWGVGIAQGWKQDDWTSVATLPLPGWTEIAELSSTLGDDAAQVWDYLITRMNPIPSSPSTDFVVTGGAAAVSQSHITFWFRAPQTFTVQRSRNGIVKPHAAGTSVRLWNTPRYGL